MKQSQGRVRRSCRVIHQGDENYKVHDEKSQTAGTPPNKRGKLKAIHIHRPKTHAIPIWWSVIMVASDDGIWLSNDWGSSIAARRKGATYKAEPIMNSEVVNGVYMYICYCWIFSIFPYLSKGPELYPVTIVEIRV